MKHAEPVSIILPTYNRADKLGDAIGSVLAQNYETFELLVIDDGSTDQTETLINSYEDKRVRYYRMEKNSGQSKARNVGMQMAKYDYLAFEDSDDLWRQGKLEGTRAVIEKDSYPVLPIFKMLQEEGSITEEMMYNTFNMGLGMILAVDPADVDKTMEAIKAAGDTPYVVGKITDGEKGVTLC